MLPAFCTFTFSSTSTPRSGSVIPLSLRSQRMLHKGTAGTGCSRPTALRPASRIRIRGSEGQSNAPAFSLTPPERF